MAQNKMEAHFTGRHNCAALLGYECNGCGLLWMTPEQGATALQCPRCKGESIEGLGMTVVGQKECNHTVDQHGHNYNI